MGLYCDFLAQQEPSTANTFGAILKQLLSRLLRESREICERQLRRLKTSLVGQSLSNMTDIVKKTITSLPRLLAVGMLSTNHVRSIDRTPGVTTGNRSGITKHASISLPEGPISLTKSWDVLGEQLGY